MDLTGILSISGYGGLFKLIKQTKTGFIVESLIDKKRMQAFASSKISTLEDIAIYTETGEMHLKEVFKKIFQHKEEKKLELTAKSSSEELKSFFEEVIPDYDKERVYVSDIKKVASWYNILVDQGLVDLKEDESKEEEETEQKQEEAEKVKKEPKKVAQKETKKETKKESKKEPKKATKKESKKED